MTRINTGTRQLAINLPTTDYDRLAQAAEKAGVSMTLAVRKAVATWTAHQIGRYQPPAAPLMCPGAGNYWRALGGTHICPGCRATWKDLGMAARPTRSSNPVPAHQLDVITPRPRPAGPEGEADQPQEP